MKKTFTLFIMLSLFGLSNVFSQILTESFETAVPPSGWTETIVTNSATPPDWSQVASGTYPICSPQTGNFMAKFNSFNCQSGGESRLKTNLINLAGKSNVQLAFWMYHDAGYSAYNDNIQIQGSTDGVNWSNIYSPIIRYSATIGWVEHIVSLSNYDNQASLYIGFLAYSGYGNDIFVDNIIINDNCSILPTITSPITYSLNATALPLTATGSNLLWYTTATGGIGSTTAPIPSTTTLGTTNYYVTQTVNGCESPRAQITVMVNLNNISSLILAESFETAIPPSGWTETILTNSATPPDWTQVASGTQPSCLPQAGSYMAKFNSFSCQSGGESRLKTNLINLSGRSNVQLSFWMYHDAGYITNNDNIQIQGSIDGLNWTNLGSSIIRYSATNGWVEQIVSLSNYDNQTSFYLGFLAHSEYGNNIFIDNIKIYDNCFSIPTGTTVRCSGSGTDIYSISDIGSSAYQWFLSPIAAGTISGLGTTGTVNWSSTFFGIATITAQALNGSCIGVSNSLTAVTGSQSGAFSLNSPANGASVSSLPSFQWVASSGTTNYVLYVDGVVKKTGITGTSYQLQSNESLTQGMHTWYVVANGCTQSLDIRSILVDATPPAAFNLLSPANNSWTTNLQPTFTWSASSDANSGLAKYQLWIDGTLNRDNIATTSLTTTPTANLANGIHTWQIKAVDNAGNIRTSNQLWNIGIDNTCPNSLLNKSLYLSSNYNNFLSVPISTNSSLRIPGNMLTLESWINVSPLSEGGGYIISKSWNNSSICEFGLRISNNTTNYHLVFGLTGNDNSWSNNIQSIQDSNVVFNFNQWYHIACVYDGSSLYIYQNGNLKAKKACNGLISNSSAATNLYIGTSIASSSAHYAGKIDEVRVWNIARNQRDIQRDYNSVLDLDCASGLMGYWKFDNNTITDYSGNANTGVLNGGASIVDSDKPELGTLNQLKLPLCSQYLSSPYVLFKWSNAMDAGIGLKKYQLWVDDALKQDNISDTLLNYSNPFSYGKHTWYVKAYDSLNNNLSSHKKDFYIDNKPPLGFNLTVPTNNQIVNLPTPNFSWQATTDTTGGSGLSKYQLWINGYKNRDSIPVSQTTTAPNTVLSQGVYTWFVRAYDLVGNYKQSATQTFYVDWEAPTAFDLISPNDNVTLQNSKPTFSWHPSSDIGSGLTKYELCISGQTPIVILPTDTVKQITYDLPNNTYTWYVKTYDLANSSTSSETRTFTINVPLPQQAGIPVGQDTVCIGTANVNYTTTGATYATSYIWSLSPSNAGTITNNGTSINVLWNATFTGNAQITVKGHNNQGDGATSAAKLIYIKPLPTISATPTGTAILCPAAPNTTYTTIGATKAESYIWSISPLTAGSITGTGLTSTVSWNNTYTGNVQIQVKAHNTCGDGNISNSLQVVVNPLPLKASKPTGTASLCQGTINSIYTTVGATNGLNYTWTILPSTAGTLVTDVTEKNATITWNPLFNGVAKIAVQGSNSCGSGNTSDTLVVSIGVSPSSPVVNTPIIYCQNSTSIPLNATGNNLLWYTSATGGIGIASVPIPSTTTLGTTNYYVSQTVNGCVSTRAEIIVSVNSTPSAPTVGTITQPSCTSATGSLVLNGLPATGSWVINPGNIIGTGTSKTITGLIAGTYNYSVANSSNCTSAASANVVINTQPSTPTAPTVGTITQPTCISLGSVILNGLPSTGNWVINPGNITGTGTSKTITGLAEGTYNYTVTNASNCTSTTSANVIINTQPITPTAPIVGTITQPTCSVATGSVVLDGLPSTGSWIINPGNITGTGTSKTITGVASSTYNYTVTNASSCTSVASANVVINTQPTTPTAPIIGTITQPSCATVTGSVVLNGLPSTGGWTINPGNISGSGSSTTISSLTTGMYNYTVTNASSCTSVASANVVINTQPTTPTAPTVGTITQPSCSVSNGSVVLSGLPASGAWIINPGNISGSGLITTISNLSAATYNFTVTNTSNCTSSASANVIINTQPLTPSAPIVGSITQPNCTVATGSVVLNGLPTIGSWTINPGNISGSGTSKTITGLITGTYNYTVTNASACTSVASANVVINTQPATPPTPIITQNGNTLFSNSTIGNQWYNLTNGIISNATATTYLPQQIGDYFSIVTISGCSSDTSNIIHYDNTGIDVINNNETLIVYPNPFKNELIIEMEGNKDILDFEILNSIGQQIFKGKIKDKTVIQTANFVPGVYLIKIKNGKNYLLKKIIKE